MTLQPHLLFAALFVSFFLYLCFSLVFSLSLYYFECKVFAIVCVVANKRAIQTISTPLFLSANCIVRIWKTKEEVARRKRREMNESKVTGCFSSSLSRTYLFADRRSTASEWTDQGSVECDSQTTPPFSRASLLIQIPFEKKKNEKKKNEKEKIRNIAK